MALYFGQDLYTNLSGDVTVSGAGDLTLASTTRTHLDQLAFLLRTSPDDYTATETRMGANIQEFIGEQISSSLLDEMEEKIRQSLIDNLFNGQDLEVNVIPIDSDEVLVYVRVEGLFVDSNGLSESEGFEAIMSFPMYEGLPLTIISYQTST